MLNARRGTIATLLCLLQLHAGAAGLAAEREPGLAHRTSIRLVRVESIIERTFTSTPIPLSPEVKSFLVPGWGQFAQKRAVPGLIFGAVEAAALATAVVFALRGSDAYRRYQDAQTPEEAVRWRDETTRADRVRNLSIAGGVVVWGLNILDVVWAQKRARRSRSGSSRPVR